MSCCPPLAMHFNGESAFEDGVMVTPIKYKGEIRYRVTRQGDMVDVYRNLNRPGLFSIRQREACKDKGKVVGYAESVILTDFKFVVGEASRQKVLREKKRSVHSFLRGRVVDGMRGQISTLAISDFLRVSYSPFVGGFFTL